MVKLKGRLTGETLLYLLPVVAQRFCQSFRNSISPIAGKAFPAICLNFRVTLVSKYNVMMLELTRSECAFLHPKANNPLPVGWEDL